jgi:hypothetical protein
MHVIRLFGEAKEFLETGKITLPRPNKEQLIDIRKGKWSMPDFMAYATQLEEDTLAARDKSPLPERVDRKEISRLVAQAYLEHWEQRGYMEKSKISGVAYV